MTMIKNKLTKKQEDTTKKNNYDETTSDRKHQHEWYEQTFRGNVGKI